MKALLCFFALLLIGLPAIAVTGAPETSSAPDAVDRDPFAPPVTATRTAVSPLARHSLAELRLVATVHGIDPPRALIEDPEGLGFVIAAGTIIGAEGCRVAGIEAGRVVVEPPVKGAARVVLLIGRQDSQPFGPR